MADFSEIGIGAVVGGIITKVIDHFLQRGKYNADVRKLEVETDRSLIAQWKELYDEVKKSQKDLNLRCDALELENERLRLECISLQHQISFKV